MVGTFLGNRKVPQVEDLIGFFINTLLIRTKISDDPQLGELLKSLKQVHYSLNF